jgi:hypothetical protein
MFGMHKKAALFLFFIIIASIFFSAWYALHNDLLFHTDIARDFLVLEEMVATKKPTLIGPRSGGIPGVFHGPLWFYLMLPPFILGQGNPVAVEWFWVFLSAASLWVTYYFGKKLFSPQVGLLAATLLSIHSVRYVHSLFNPFGAVLLAPVFFYFFWKYVKEKKFSYLISSVFTLGIIIQFQMAFGVPIFLLLFLYVSKMIVKNKQFSHFLAFCILIIPLSTFLLFDLRHDFLQVRSVMNYITGKEDSGQMTLPSIVVTRVKGALFEGANIMPLYFPLMVISALVVFSFLLLGRKKADPEKRQMYSFFLYFYFGYWIIACLFKGSIWGYYYWPFLPIVLILFSSAYQFIPRKIFWFIFLFFVVANSWQSLKEVKNSSNFIGKSEASWKFNSETARKVYSGAKDQQQKEFGFYLYTPDLYAYTPRYAFNYIQKEFPDIQARPYQKKDFTFLLIAPPPADKPYLNGQHWKEAQVKVKRPADKSEQFPNGVVLEEHHLSETDQQINSDPNLIQDLHFR